MSQVLINESTLQAIADKIRCFQPMTTKTVIGYYYNVTQSWGHTVNLSSYFPNLNYSYFLLTSGSSSTGSLKFYQDGVSDVKTYLDNEGAARIVIPATGKNLQYQEIINFGNNKYTASFIVYPLDQNMNFIIYNASQHGSLPTRTVTWYFPSSQLYYPNEFANKIGGGSRIYRLQAQVGTGAYYNKYIADPVNNNYYRPWQDLRFYGVHDITDIKLFVVTGKYNSRQNEFFSASFMEPVDKGDPWGLGFPLKYTSGNYTYPQGGSRTIHLKGNRLWMPDYTGTSDFAFQSRGQQAFLIV